MIQLTKKQLRKCVISPTERAARALERIAEVLAPGAITVPVTAKITTTARFHKVSAEAKLMPRSAKAWDWVYDATTGLVWARSLLPDSYTFKDAAKAARDVTLGGVATRLATANERTTIIDFSRVEPALDIEFFDPTQRAGWEWTSTVDASSPRGFAWVVYLGYGDVYRYNQSSRNHVRPVLAGQSFGFPAFVAQP